MKSITIILFAMIASHAWAQPPAIEWQKTYGSSNFDYPFSVIQTADGGFLVSGYSLQGSDNDKSSFVGASDYWVIRLDQNGTKLWDRTFGGTADDILSSAVETPDGGFILGGYSHSPASGDKTGSSKGGYDFWIVKIDNSGNKIWDKVIGGTGQDQLYSIARMAGGRYALGGYSSSHPSGDKSSHRGATDYWVVIIDESGQLIWERSYGGYSDDFLRNIIATSDGGLIMTGYSISNASLDKSESVKGSSYDYWVVKIDGAGSKMWDRTLGGPDTDYSYGIVEMPDGGYIVAGYSNSRAGYDKSQNPLGNWNTYQYCNRWCSDGWGGYDCCGWGYAYYYYYDYWVVKLTSTGAQQWNRTYGTTLDDILQGITVLEDGFLLTGHSSGSTSSHKSEPGRGSWDNWMLKIDPSGNRTWDKTFGGNFSDQSMPNSGCVTRDGGFIVATLSLSGISGDKTEASKGSSDYWIVKFEPMADVQPPVFQSLLASIKASTQPGTCDAVVTWTGPTVTDNVGVVSLTSSPALGSTFPLGQTTVTYTARDAAGNTATTSFIVSVTDNEAPVPLIAELPVLSGECSVEVTTAPMASDNCSGEITGQTTDPLLFTEQGTYSITWTYDDGNGNVFSQVQSVTVDDVTPPTISGLDDIIQPVEEDLCGALIWFSEPDAVDNCGLKSVARVDDVLFTSGEIFPEGTFEIIYQAIDLADNVSLMSFRITVLNEVPEINSVSTSLDPHPINTSVPVTVAFTDENVVTSEINWGDGSTTSGTLGAGILAAEHVYASPGVYSVGIRLIDACGLETSTLYQYVVIYDPEGGFVTGGGWFHSPEGAYTANTQVTGKATFGFVSKYKPGSTVPTGNTDFQFQAADLKFKSTSYEWLVVAGHKAMYKGKGMFNGSADHGFLVSGVDGAKNSGPDKFRIKIWDPSGTVVYDNQNGDAEDAEATTVLGGGSIVIHVVNSKTSSASGRMYVATEPSIEREEKINSAYPNPFKDRITVAFHSMVEDDINIHLLDAAGQSLYEKGFAFNSEGLYEVDLSSRSLARKVYFLKVTQGRRIEYLKVLRE